VGATQDGVAVITAGLHLGERVVTDGQMSLKAGLTVAVQPPAGHGPAKKPAA